MMANFYKDDLIDFTRYGKLDAFELTDEELVHMLEVWRWSVGSHDGSPDEDVRAAAQCLQRHLARAHNVEVEYNTALLLKQEIEPLIYMRALLHVPQALGYFLRHAPALIRALRQHRRYQSLAPVRDTNGAPLGYPRAVLDSYHGRPPDVLHRPYWRQLSPYDFEARKRLDEWW
ncbi:MAG: hypothetical protein ABI700_25565 [Chloroflexota bacterium]